MSQDQGQSERTIRLHNRNCFGNFNGNNYDVSRLSPVQALGKLSADTMMISDRVGDPDEDETKVQARPYLSEINRRGLVTTDSQIGRDEVLQNVNGENYRHKQRSYVSGVLPRRIGK